MSCSSERLARSLLFVPADRPDRFEKAAGSGAHGVILDLEDAVAPTAKTRARDAACAWLASGAAAIVRVNAIGTPWFDDDIRMVREAPNARVMLPKADAEGVAHLAGQDVIALLETVKGVIDIRRLAGATSVHRIAFGSVDFATETGIADEGEALTPVRTQIVLESLYAGLQPPIDGVSLEFSDDQIMRAHALRSRRLGFGGKLCIHPRQVAAANDAFCPDEAEVRWAQRCLDASEASNGAATSVDGVMVDKPVVERARRILADARAAKT